jgi:hypothetical protein
VDRRPWLHYAITPAIIQMSNSFEGACHDIPNDDLT